MSCSSLFVSDRLKSLVLLPELLPLIHSVKDAPMCLGCNGCFPSGGSQGRLELRV
jgi:hypothetical protein